MAFFYNEGAAPQLDKEKRLDWRMRVSTERQRGTEMESERDPRRCEALPSRCLASLSLIGLPPPSLPFSPSLPPSCDKSDEAAGPTPHPHPCLQPKPIPPLPRLHGSVDWLRRGGSARRRRRRRSSEEEEEEQQILIHLMGPVLPPRMIRGGMPGLGGAEAGRQAGIGHLKAL